VRQTILFAVGVIILDAMGIGLLMPVLPDILAELQGIDPKILHQADSYNPIGEIAGIGMWLTAVYMGMQFLFGPTLGNLSDRFGRRPVLLISLLALGIDYIILGFAGSIWVLFLGRILAGIAGATYGTAYAAIADISNKENKARNFGFVGAGFGIGFILGPAIGAALAGLDVRAPIFAAALLSFVNLVFGYLFFQETLPKKRQRPFDFRRANPVGALQQIRKVPQIHGWLLSAFLFGIAFTVYPAVWSYYGRAVAGWDRQEVGISLAVFGVSFAIVQIFLLGPMVNRIGPRRVLAIGIWSAFLCFLGLGLAQNGTHIYMTVPLSALSIVVNPMISSILSNSVSEDVQGELQGINTSLAAVGSTIAPFIMVGAFIWGTPSNPDKFSLPGAPFLICACLMLSLILITRRQSAL